MPSTGKQYLDDVTNKVKALRVHFMLQTRKLPDNPDIIRIGYRHFTVPFSKLDNNWSPHYHDFKLQYKELRRIIAKTRLENLSTVITGIIETGQSRLDRESIKFHPTVCQELKKIWEG